MNVLFHTTAAIGVAVMLTDREKAKADSTFSKTLLIGIFAFIVGVITHGIMDYIPHCYPINSKIDAIVSLIIIFNLLWFTYKPYRIITGLSIFGSVFPDLVDLSPQILNKYTGLDLPITDKYFPWHWKEYSGSVYNGSCTLSTLNHCILIFMVILICWVRRKSLKQMFKIPPH